MGRAYEKSIRRAQEVQAAVGRTPERTEPRTRAEVASFVAGFALSAAAQRRIVDEWMADQERTRDTAYDQGWESRADSEYFAQW
jgi:hypothetical protein